MRFGESEEEIEVQFGGRCVQEAGDAGGGKEGGGAKSTELDIHTQHYLLSQATPCSHSDRPLCALLLPFSCSLLPPITPHCFFACVPPMCPLAPNSRYTRDCMRERSQQE